MTNETDAGKDQRVVLNLNLGQAKMLSAAMQHIAEDYKEACEEKDFATKISARLNKTIAKRIKEDFVVSERTPEEEQEFQKNVAEMERQREEEEKEKRDEARAQEEIQRC